MKFVCDSCSARYVIDDERVRGKVLHIRCKKCGHVMEVREPVAPTPAAGRVPAGARRATTSIAFDDVRRALEQEADGAPEADAEWYYSINGESFGPYREDELMERFQSGTIGDEAFLWQQGFDDWKPAASIPVFVAALQRGKRSARRAATSTMAIDAAELAALRQAAESAIRNVTDAPPGRTNAAEEARAKADAIARERAEREAKERAERERAAREAKERADRDARERAEREARERADRETRERAEREARERADRDAKERAEREARERAEEEQRRREAAERAEREAREREAELRRQREEAEQAARAARAEAERAARAEREAQDRRARERREEEQRKETEARETLRKKRLADALQRAAQASMNVPAVADAATEESASPPAPTKRPGAALPAAKPPRVEPAPAAPPTDEPAADATMDDDDAATPPSGSASVDDGASARVAEAVTAPVPVGTRDPVPAPEVAGDDDATPVPSSDAGDLGDPTTANTVPVPIAAATPTRPADPKPSGKAAGKGKPARKASPASADAAAESAPERAASPPAAAPRKATSKVPVAGAAAAKRDVDADLFDLETPTDVPLHTVGAPTVSLAPRKGVPTWAIAAVAAAALVLVFVVIGSSRRTAETPAPPAATGTVSAPAPAVAAADPVEGSGESAEGSGETEVAAATRTPQQLARRAQNFQVNQARADRVVSTALETSLEAVITQLSQGRTSGALSANRIESLRAQQQRSRGAQRPDTTAERPSNGATTAARTDRATPPTTPDAATTTTATAPQGIFGQLGTPGATPTVAGRIGRAEPAQAATPAQFQQGLSTFVQQAIGRCKTRATAEEGDLPSSRVELEIRVNPNGTVDSSSVSAGPAFAGTAFQRCLQTYSGRWNFGEFAGDPITLRRTYIVQ